VLVIWHKLKELIVLSRPEWGFIFAAVSGMLGMFYQLPVPSVFIGWLSIYLFTAGHFALNGYYDRNSDIKNPRGFSLRNPLIKGSVLSKNDIFIWVVILWLILIPLNFIFVPNSTLLAKTTLAFVTWFIAMGGSLLYSIPPFRVKARPFLDIVITVFIIGISVPVYIGLLGPNVLVSIDKLTYGIILSVILVAGIHLPTQLIDLDTDAKVGDMTTAVYLGWKKASYLTSVLILFRVIGLALINLVLMHEGLLIVSVAPFFLGLVEILTSINLIEKQNRNAAVGLFNIVIITSCLGSIIFGILYAPVLSSTYL